jgi:UDP:flavonoid glycosyltransferase YjiC (YdhE family)
MRILMTSVGASGHVLPLVPFARALERSGHEVLVAAQRAQGPKVERTGLAFAPFDDPPEELWKPLIAEIGALGWEEAGDRIVAEMFGTIDVRAALPGLLGLVERWQPDVVVRESCEFAGALAAERHGIPHARVVLGSSSVEDYLLERATPAIDALRAELGFAPDPDGRALRDALYMTMAPESLEPLGHAPAAGIHRFRDERRPARPAPGGGDPLVYVSFGTVAGGKLTDIHRIAIDALAGLRVRVLVTTGDAFPAGDLGPLPSNVQVESWVDEDEVLPHAAVMVAHGGYGSTLRALTHGVPQVVVPLFAADQWLNGRTVAALGAGVALEDSRAAFDVPGQGVRDALPGAVMRMIERPAHRRQARRVSSEIAALPPAQDAVRLLEDYSNSTVTRSGRESRALSTVS